MANLKELRNRISSVSSTMQITSAMKMVSAAKLKRAQDGITQMRPYAEKLEEILMNVTATLDASEGVYSRKSETNKKVLLIAVASNRGLAGAFNSNIIKAVVKYTKETTAEVDVLCIGRKAFDILRKRDVNVIGEHNSLFDDASFENVGVIAQKVMDLFADEAYDRVEVVYNRFLNAASQKVQVEQFLPVKEPETASSDAQVGDYIYEPSKEEILEDLIPKSLRTQLFKAVLDSIASEHGARMTAMHKATDNASELRRQLKLDYNKARQAAITNEILEIVGGAEALNA